MTPSAATTILRRHGLNPPVTLTASITGACNLACAHCWVDAGRTESQPPAPERQLRNLVREFAAMEGTGLRITGGEPLCHPGWLRLIRLARELNLRTVTLQTNAMLLTDRDVASLQELDFHGLTVQVSLDGASAPTHDLVRGTGTFEKAMTGIQRLVSAGMGQRIALFFTEMRHNLEELPALFERADALSINTVTTGMLVRCGRAADTPTVAPPDPSQYLALLDRYDNDPRFHTLYDRIGTIAALEWRTSGHRTDCCTFVENPYLTPNGTLYPCLFLHADPFAVTGLFEKGLASGLAEGAALWSELRETSRLRCNGLPECRDCPEQPSCAGGCMGRAWGSFNSLRAPDDRCLSRKTICRQSNRRTRP